MKTLDTFLICSVPSSFSRMCSPAAEDKQRSTLELWEEERQYMNNNDIRNDFGKLAISGTPVVVFAFTVKNHS